MRALVIAGIAILTSASVSAHRLDEYLQAARVSFARGGIAVEIDLTPGANVADAVIALVDRDENNTISPLEAESYGRAVLTDVLLELDGNRIPLNLSRVEIPSTDEMRHGMGTIQLRAIAEPPRRVAWRPQLRFRNDHRPESSVYLVNALIPTDSDITVVRQARDQKQRDVRIDYAVTPQWAKQLYWPAIGGLALLFITRPFAHRYNEKRKSNNE